MAKGAERAHPLQGWLKTTRLYPLRVIAVNIAVLLFFAVLLAGSLHHGTLNRLARSLGASNTEFERSYSHVLERNCASKLLPFGGRIDSTQVDRSHLTYFTFAPADRNPLRQIRLEGPVEVMLSFNRSALLLDVGANVGKVTFPTLAMEQDHHVIAVEPVSDALDVLCRNAVVNGLNRDPRLTLVHAALSDEDSETDIFVPSSGDQAAMSQGASRIKLRAVPRTERVFAVAGDRLLDAAGLRPDVIKIDTQGHELQVMRGLKRYLRDADPLVIAESDPRLMRLSGVNPKDVYQLMVTELGYTPFYKAELVEIDGKLTARGVVIPESVYPTKRAFDIYYFKV